jgi:integrase
MNLLSRRLKDYLELRQHLGFKLHATSRELRQFVRFARQQRASFITTKLALRWATQSTTCQPARWTTLLGKVRRFAEYLSALDPRTEIPPQGLLPHRYHRKTPYLYSDREVVQLIQAAQQIPSPKGLRATTYSTLFGLLAVTGMRVGEALHLDREDVQIDQNLLQVRQAKFSKSRWVPVHPTTGERLRQYQRLRDRVCPHPQSPGFFLSERGTRLAWWNVRHWFLRVSYQIGLRPPRGHRSPRLHDLRHRFASKVILTWYRRGMDVEAHLPQLTTYLGHGHVTDTYWYISATPELLKLATQRLEHRKGGVSA